MVRPDRFVPMICPKIIRMVAALASLAAATATLAQQPQNPFEAHFRLGQYFLARGDTGRAVSEFEDAVRLAPENADAQYNFAVASRQWGDVDVAERALRKAIELRREFPEAHFVLGLLLGDRVGFEHLGLSEFQTAIAQRPGYAEAHFNIGIVHWKADDGERALAAFRRAIELNPESAEYRARLGQALVRLDRLPEAIEELKSAVESDPESFDAHYQLGRALLRQGVDREAARRHIEIATAIKEEGASSSGGQSQRSYRDGMLALQQGRVKDAIGLLTSALDGAENESAVRSALGIANQRNGDLAKAAAEFRRVIEANPESPDAHLNYGTLRLMQGDAGAAEREFRECLQIDPSFVEAHFNLGLLYAGSSNWADAESSLRTAIRLQPNHVRARWNLARILRDAGNTELALREFAVVCDRDASLLEAHLEFGELLAVDGETGNALAVWRRALEHDPIHQRLHDRLLEVLEQSGEIEAAGRERHRFALLNSESKYREGIRALDAGSFAQAAAIFRSVLGEHPDLDAVRRRLAFALFANQEYGAAASEYRRMLEMSPEDTELRLNLGSTLWRMSSYAEARQELDVVLRRDPQSVRALHQIALAYWDEGDRGRAIEFFRRARRLDPNIMIPQ